MDLDRDHDELLSLGLNCGVAEIADGHEIFDVVLQGREIDWAVNLAAQHLPDLDQAIVNAVELVCSGLRVFQPKPLGMSSD